MYGMKGDPKKKRSILSQPGKQLSLNCRQNMTSILHAMFVRPAKRALKAFELVIPNEGPMQPPAFRALLPKVRAFRMMWLIPIA